MDRPFYYRSAGDFVPRDAVYVIVCGSVTVVPPYTFRGCRNLARVELREGVEEIGKGAFRDCPNLERVDCRASSLRTIGDFAFAWCRRLLEVVLREGLRRIGEGAFDSSGLGRIAVPSSVADIGKEAFALCENLEAVTLAGGMVMVARGAFFDCPRLERIAISSAAIVVEAGEDADGGAAAVTGRIEWNAANNWDPRLIMASPHLASMRPEQLRDLTDAIDLIADWTHETGPLDLADRDVSGQIRECFVYRLSVWYTWYKREVATILELGLWKMELGRAREASKSRAAGKGETAGTDVPTRDAFRRTCGADPIVGLVLSSLAGPHRRADQAENAGSIQR